MPPHKLAYLRHNWLTALALVAPALRLLRIVYLVRAARAARGLRLLRVVSTANRGLRTARRVLARRGVGYVLAINVLVLLVGAGGIYSFEQPPQGGLKSLGDALWWTAMLLTTLGSSYEPVTFEGRLLTWLLALFAFSVFGYVTATLASFFVHQDQKQTQESSGQREKAQSESLQAEIAQLRAEVRALREALLLPRAEVGRPDT
ncbi:MAG TPA: potassium channel family protein [Chthonomonadaceae bacterium]|nr:potassium channel family protein [Chthonomonadaceae bacterium]